MIRPSFIRPAISQLGKSATAFAKKNAGPALQNLAQTMGQGAADSFFSQQFNKPSQFDQGKAARFPDMRAQYDRPSQTRHSFMGSAGHLLKDSALGFGAAALLTGGGKVLSDLLLPKHKHPISNALVGGLTNILSMALVASPTMRFVMNQYNHTNNFPFGNTAHSGNAHQPQQHGMHNNHFGMPPQQNGMNYPQNNGMSNPFSGSTMADISEKLSTLFSKPNTVYHPSSGFQNVNYANAHGPATMSPLKAGLHSLLNIFAPSSLNIPEQNGRTGNAEMANIINAEMAENDHIHDREPAGTQFSTTANADVGSRAAYERRSSIDDYMMSGANSPEPAPSSQPVRPAPARTGAFTSTSQASNDIRMKEIMAQKGSLDNSV